MSDSAIPPYVIARGGRRVAIDADAILQWAAHLDLAEREAVRRYWSAQSAKRRAAIVRAKPPWADRKAIAALYADAERITRETGIPHEVDHFYALQARLVSGLHVQGNLRIVTRKTNRAKGNRLDEPDG